LRDGWQPASFDDESFVLVAGPGWAGLDLNEEIPVFSLAQPFTAGRLRQRYGARFIGLLPSLELKQYWKPDESGLQFDLSLPQP
jgi:hypothetical protein